jgi:hypothetical protein
MKIKPIFVNKPMPMQKLPMSKLRITAMLIFLFPFLIQAQPVKQGDSLIRYTPEFKFKDGIYLNFDQVRMNEPIYKSRIITDIPYDNPDFFDQILKQKKIELFDHIGTRQEVPTKNIWGFASNGVLYINFKGNFFRITLIGSICHFVANVTTYSNDILNPYYGYPYYNPYNPYYSPYRGGTPDIDIKQLLLDFKTGNVLEYNEESVELLLMPDAQLYDEFVGLSKKKQKQLKFVYIRKFNEKNPLYFPVN